MKAIRIIEWLTLALAIIGRIVVYMQRKDMLYFADELLIMYLACFFLFVSIICGAIVWKNKKVRRI